MAISVEFEREDHSTYTVELEPDWKLHLTDGGIIFAEDLEVGDEIQSHYSEEEPGNRGHIAIRVMGDE